MFPLTESLAYIASFGCALFAAHLLAVRSAAPLPTRLLGVNFATYAVQAGLLGAHLGEWLPPGLLPLRPTLAMALGPLLFLYFESAAEARFRLRPRDALHLVPGILIAVQFAAGIFWIDVDFAIFASFGAYAVALGLRVRAGSCRFSHLGSGERKAFRLLVVAAAALAAWFIAEIAIHLDLERGLPLRGSPALLTVLLAELALVGLAILAALSRPSPFDWMYAAGGPDGTTPAARVFASGEAERATNAAAFDRLVAADRVWLDEGVTLAAVARRLDIPARRLSEAINSVHGMSFSRRLNQLRIEEAKRLLREAPDQPVIAVMFDAGFRTKSSFNREFRAIAGMSPTEYRERNR